MLNAENSMEKNLYLEGLFERPKSLASLLPYDEYLADKKIFVMADGSLGAIFRLETVEHEVKKEGEIIAAIQSLKPLFDLLDDFVLQVIFDQKSLAENDPIINKFENLKGIPHPVSQMILNDRLLDIKKLTNDGKLFQRNCFVTIRMIRKDGGRKGLRNRLGLNDQILDEETKEFLSDVRQFEATLKDISENSAIALNLIDADGLLGELRSFFNSQESLTNAPLYQKTNSLKTQYLFEKPKLSLTGVERPGFKTKTLTLKTSPDVSYPGATAYLTKLNFPFRIAVNFTFPKEGKVKRFFDLKEFFLENTPTAKARVQKEELLQVQDKLARGDRCMHMTFTITVFGQSEDELDDRVRSVKRSFQSDLDCQLVEEKDIGLGLCLASLPLSYIQEIDYSAQRYVRMMRSDALNFLPVFDSFRGLHTPLALYSSRERGLVPFSLLDNETSNHTVVLADSGSGKSAFVIDCIQAAKRLDPEPLVFVIDKKSSYKMLGEYFDCDFTSFDRSGEIPFSVFRGKYDDEKLASLTNLIVTSISLTSSEFQMASEQRALITRAIKGAHHKKREARNLLYEDGEIVETGDGEEVVIEMADVVYELATLGGEDEKLRSSANELLLKLKPFYGDGMYARFFSGNGPAEKKSKLFYVYDLDALDGDPILQSLMTMALIQEIKRLISLEENEGRTGFIVFEEFAMLGRKNPMFRDFAVDFAETMRKKGVWLITLTPRPQNYFELEVGKAFWSVADNFIFLQMNGDNVEYLKEKSSLFDEANSEIIKSLRTVRGSHADIFYMNKNKSRQGVFRYEQSPLMRWLSPTNAKDALCAIKALASHKDKWQALSYLKTTYPKGADDENLNSNESSME